MTRTLALLVGVVIGGGASLTYNIVRTSNVAHRNCVDITALAKINRGFVEGQAAQTNALLSKGFTFGIPKDQLPALIARNTMLQHQFLGELDELARNNC